MDETLPILPLPLCKKEGGGGCADPTGWGLHWLTAFPAQGDQWNRRGGEAKIDVEDASN